MRGDQLAPVYTVQGFVSADGKTFTSTSADTIVAAKTINAQNTAPAGPGAAPAASILALDTNNRATAGFHVVTNTLSVALSPYGTVDGANWVLIGGTPLLNQATGTLSATIPAATTGIFTMSSGDFAQVRLSTPNSATTGAASVAGETSATPAILAIDNIVSTFERRSATANSTVVSPLAATVITLLAANTARLGASLFNGSGQPLFVKLGAAASATSFTTTLATGTYYEVPFGYTGIITGFSTLASAAPNVLVTEFIQ